MNIQRALLIARTTIAPIILVMYISCSSTTEEIIERYSSGLKKRVHIYNTQHELIEIRTFHFNNIRESVTEIKTGLPNGSYRSWRLDGSLYQTGGFTQGRKSGMWTNWHSQEQPAIKGIFINNAEEGLWQHYYNNGSLKLSAYYRRGIPDSSWIYYAKNGLIEKSDNCHNSDSLFFKSYYFTGIVKEQYECRDTLKTGLYLYNYENGTPQITGKYSDSSPDSIWYWFYATGALAIKKSFVKGVRHGEQLRLSVNGDTLSHTNFEYGSGRESIKCNDDLTQICADTLWNKGKIEGTSYALDFATHITKVTQWKNSIKVHEKILRDNKLVSEGGYKSGLREGVWKLYYQNGTLKELLHFESDMYLGKQLYYDSTGRLTMKRTYFGKGKKVEIELIKSE